MTREQRDNAKMSLVAQDIMKTKLPENMKKEMLDIFFNIMRKHGIKQGTKESHGILVANFEWTMCQVLFLDAIKANIELDLLMDSVPEDLFHY